MVDTELPNAFLNTIHSVRFFFPLSYNMRCRERRIRKFPLSNLPPDFLTLRDTVVTSGGSSSRDAHCVSLFGNQLSIPCSAALRFAEVLLKDVPPTETVGS